MSSIPPASLSGQSESLAKRLAALEAENEKLRLIILKTGKPEAGEAYLKEKGHQIRAENNAKFLAGELGIDPTEFEKSASLIASQPDQVRVEQWLRDLDGLSWSKTPLETFHRATMLALSYRLNPRTPIPGKKRRPNIWFELLHHIRQFHELVVEGCATEMGREAAGIGEDFAARSGVKLPNAPQEETNEEVLKPRLLHPGNGRLVKETTAEVIRVLRQDCPDLLFRRQRGGLCTLRSVDDRLDLFPLCPVDLVGLVDDQFTPGLLSDKGYFIKRSLCPKDAEAMMNAFAIAHADVLDNIVAAPLLIRRQDDTLALLQYGYDRESRVFVTSREELPTPTVEEAVKTMEALFCDFFFLAESDRSRHLAGFFLPAMCMGGFLDGDRPIDVTEALESQTGKGFRVKLIGAIYAEEFSIVVQSKGGLDQAFDTEVIKGRPLILIENFRGSLNSQKIETFITPVGSYTCRTLFKNTTVDPRRYFLFLTSNGAELTKDLTERFLVTRLKKVPSGYHFWRSEKKGLNLLDYIKVNQPKFLAAVQAIIGDWWLKHRMKGGGLTNESRHSFRATIQALDFIVQHYFQLPPIMDGMEEVKKRSTDAYLSFLRELSILVMQMGNLGQVQKPSNLVEICDKRNLAIPGMDRRSNTEDKQKRLGGILSTVMNLRDEESAVLGIELENKHKDDLNREPKLIKSLDFEGFTLQAWGVWDTEYRRPRRSFIFRYLSVNEAVIPEERTI